MFTTTESAILAIFYTPVKGLMKSLETTSWLTGRVLIIMFTAYSFGRLFVQYRVPDMIAETLLSLTSDIHLTWALIIIFLLFRGMFME